MAGFVLNEHTSRLINDIKGLDKKFRKSCDQILLLNNQIEDLQVRYDRAMKTNRRSFRYSLRLRLATLEGVRNMFYEYASRCADQLQDLQNQLVDSDGREDIFDENVELEPVVSSEDEDNNAGSPARVDEQPFRTISPVPADSFGHERDGNVVNFRHFQNDGSSTNQAHAPSSAENIRDIDLENLNGYETYNNPSSDSIHERSASNLESANFSDIAHPSSTLGDQVSDVSSFTDESSGPHSFNFEDLSDIADYPVRISPSVASASNLPRPLTPGTIEMHRSTYMQIYEDLIKAPESEIQQRNLQSVFEYICRQMREYPELQSLLNDMPKPPTLEERLQTLREQGPASSTAYRVVPLRNQSSVSGSTEQLHSELEQWHSIQTDQYQLQQQASQLHIQPQQSQEQLEESMQVEHISKT